LPLGVRLQMLSVVTDSATITHPFPAKETPKVVPRVDNPTFVRYHRGAARGQLPVDNQNIPPDVRETLRRSQGGGVRCGRLSEVAVVTGDRVRIHKYVARSHEVLKAGDVQFSQTSGFFRSLRNSQFPERSRKS
jgi:hypothetical protein